MDGMLSQEEINALLGNMNIGSSSTQTNNDNILSDEEKDAITRRLGNQIALTNADKSGFSKGVMVLTVPETKGLEFDCVILWKPDMTGYRDNPKLAKLLYVAATRALHELVVMK